VNEAWQAAGFEGTISPTLVNKTRVKLTGKRRGYSKTAAKGKSAPNMPKTVIVSPGKTMFVKEFLNDHPEGNVKAANEAWTAAGFDGTISETLIYKARASLGLTGNLSGKTKAAAEGKATSTGKKTRKTSEGAHGSGQWAATRAVSVTEGWNVRSNGPETRSKASLLFGVLGFDEQPECPRRTTLGVA